MGHPDLHTIAWWDTRQGRAALGALLIFALGYALQIARPLCLPVVLALLLAIVLAPVVRWLRRLRLPATLAAAIVVATFTGATGCGVYALADPATAWIERAPSTIRVIEQRVRSLKASVLEAVVAAEKVEAMTRVEGQSPPAEVTVKEPSIANRMVAMTPVALLLAAEVIILLYFMLAFGESFFGKIVNLSGRLRSKIQIISVTAELKREVSAYLLTVTCINAALGTATAIAMWALKMPNPVLWGVMAALLNFIPYLGSAVTLVVLTLVAILTFETIGRSLLVPAIFLGLATLEGQFVTPIILGRRMSLSPPMIVLALLVGGWIWGVVGLLVAVPVLAMIKIYCAHNESLVHIAELLAHE